AIEKDGMAWKQQKREDRPTGGSVYTLRRK
ncbi:hypothetical protein AVEN_195962-1, partial [Araneus ventricosus]